MTSNRAKPVEIGNGLWRGCNSKVMRQSAEKEMRSNCFACIGEESVAKTWHLPCVWPPVLALLRTVRQFRFGGCHLDIPESSTFQHWENLKGGSQRGA